MPHHVLWRSALAADRAADMKTELGPDFELVVETDKDRLAPYLSRTEILVDGHPSEEALDAPKLEHVIVPWAGISEHLRDGVLGRPHLKLYNSHYNASFVAQHAVALLLATANRLLEADRSFRQRDWRLRYDDSFNSVSLLGKTCLLLGYGAIGREVEARLRPFGMKMSALRRRPRGESSSLKVYGPDNLHEALRRADAVIVSVPHTAETDSLLSQAAFAAMKERTLLVNVGRGKVIDQWALYEALKAGRILAAGLDVWWNYPENKEARPHTFPADAPLHELPNLIMSPHRATQVDAEGQAVVEDVAQTLRAIANGKARNRVDLKRGY